MERLDALVGTWTIQAGPPDGPPWPGRAQAAFEWLEGRAFLIQRWTVDLPEAPDGIAIIGPGDEPESFQQHYFDSRGVRRIYDMTLRDGLWTLGDRLRPELSEGELERPRPCGRCRARRSVGRRA